MRYAIFSDVHANAAALRAVLADAADARAEKLVCLGDVLGYGPEPVAALELVYRTAHVCLAGNHDDAVTGRFPVADFTSVAAAAVERHRAALAPPALDWLGHLPHVCAFPGFACAHGDFAAPERFDYILEAPDARPSWCARTEPLLFVGHSHKPGIFVLGPSGVPHALEPSDFVLEDGKRYIVNVGSVGYPRSGVCRSSYCLYDDATRTVTFRSLPFDLEGYRAKMNGAGMDEAPWLRARAAERARPDVRSAEKFGKSPAPGGAKSSRRAAVPGRAKPSRRAVPVGLVPFARFLPLALLVAGVGVWCAPRLLPPPPSPPASADAADLLAPAAPESVPPPLETGAVVAQGRCTVPAGGRRLRFRVKLRRGRAPAWVHLRFEDGNGAAVGDGVWFPGVRASKKSPKTGIVAPEGATAAFLEVVQAHAGDACAVDELVLEPFR